MADIYFNRELSWLAFNARVLQEAANPKVPLIERIKFLGIYSSNLDEFYRVRVATLKRMSYAGKKAARLLAAKPEHVLKQIHHVVLHQRKLFEELFASLVKELERENIILVSNEQLTGPQMAFVQRYFREHVRQNLVPIMLDQTRVFPNLADRKLYLAVHLSYDDHRNKGTYSIIELPTDALPRFLVLPSVGKRKYVMLLDDLVRHNLPEIYAIFDYNVFDSYTFKVTRDAELDISEDVTQSWFEKISNSLKQRKKGDPVQIIYDDMLPDKFLQYLIRKLHISKKDGLIPGGRYHNKRDFIKFPAIGRDVLRYRQLPPLPHKDLTLKGSIFKSIKSKDILLHYPYHSFQYLVELLREAAIDPKVEEIYLTAYRVAKHSKVLNALINAVRNGKDVTVVMELQARFDEEANIKWTRRLRDEGVSVIHGIPGVKVHAKLLMITRKEAKGTMRYCYLSTGNFNEDSATSYSDHGLFTADKRICSDVKKLFEFLGSTYKPVEYKHLLVAPFTLRDRLIALVNKEIKNATAGKPAHIWLKLNNLEDRQMIDKLYEASRAGVQIRLIIRGSCSLIAGIKGRSETIAAISIIDKYLEHSRIFIFANGGEEILMLSSADWMSRNLDRRIEVALPILDPAIKRELRDFFLRQWEDNTKARELGTTQNNAYRVATGAKCRFQEDFYDSLLREISIQETSEGTAL